jgi:hypothetical protein
VKQERRGVEDRTSIGSDLGAGGTVLVVAKSRSDSGTTLDHDSATEVGEGAGSRRSEGNPAFEGLHLSKDSDDVA